MTITLLDCEEKIDLREGLQRKARNVAKRSEDLQRKARPERARHNYF
jgi:hypothetical protein